MINLGKSAGKPLADKLGLISVKQLETQNIRFFGNFSLLLSRVFCGGLLNMALSDVQRKTW